MENLNDSELSSLWTDDTKINMLFFENLNFEKTKYIKKENLIEFSKRGFTIIKNAIPFEDIDKLLNCINDEKFKKNDDVFSSYGENISKLSDNDINKPITKILDLYVKFNEAKQILCHDSIKEFLEFVYKEPAKIFQSLYLKKGSTQCLHQDPAYVVIQPHPYNIIACWIALEDVKEGSGELMYIPESHNKMKFRYGNGRMHFNREKDSDMLHHHHLHVLKEMSKEFPLVHYFPKKGDILFWHAGLVHGGSEITDESLTRQSIVGHYCPNSEWPYYYNFDNNRFVSDFNNIKLVSMYYKGKL